MLHYEYHYPLTPIQSASFDIHPAFRNDPELAAFMADDTEPPIPPPRNPLRTAMKPLFSVTAQEAKSSSLSLAQRYGDESSTLSLPALHTSIPASCTSHYRAATQFTQILPSETSSTASSPKSYTSSGFPSSANIENYYHHPPVSSSQSSSRQSALKPMSPTLPSTSTFTACTLSALPCPPNLQPQEWSFFLNDIQNAIVLSRSQKALSLAFCLAIPVARPIFKSLDTRGLERYHSVENVRTALEKENCENKRGRESLQSVIERWNVKWEEKELRVDLDITQKRKGEKRKLRLVVSEFGTVKADSGYGSGSEDEAVIEKNVEIQEATKSTAKGRRLRKRRLASPFSL